VSFEAHEVEIVNVTRGLGFDMTRLVGQHVMLLKQMSFHFRASQQAVKRTGHQSSTQHRSCQPEFCSLVVPTKKTIAWKYLCLVSIHFSKVDANCVALRSYEHEQRHRTRSHELR
jgi:hypothetical protein